MPRLIKPSATKTQLRVRWQLPLDGYPLSAALSADGSVAAALTSEGELVLIDVRTGELRIRRRAHAEGAALAWSPREPVLATCGHDARARLFDAEGRAGAELDFSGSAWVDHVAWSPDGGLLAVAAGRRVRLWRPTGEPFLETEAHASTVTGLAWRSSGQVLASACYGGIHLWEIAAFATSRHLSWPGSLISLAWSPDERIVAAGSQDCSVHFWRLAEGTDAEMRGYPLKPRALAWDARSTMLATGGDATISVWRFEGDGPEGTKPTRLTGHQAACTHLAFAPGRGLLASAGEDCGVLLWEPRRGGKPVRWASVGDTPTSLAWHPRGAGLLVADASGGLSFLDVEPSK